MLKRSGSLGSSLSVLYYSLVIDHARGLYHVYSLTPLSIELIKVVMEMGWRNREALRFNLVHSPLMLPSDVSALIPPCDIDSGDIPLTHSPPPPLLLDGYAFSQEDHGITRKVKVLLC